MLGSLMVHNRGAESGERYHQIDVFGVVLLVGSLLEIVVDLHSHSSLPSCTLYIVIQPCNGFASCLRKALRILCHLLVLPASPPGIAPDQARRVSVAGDI